MAAAVVREGHAESVTLGNHGVAVPSVVFLGDEGLLVGEAAVLRSASEPSRVAREFKRRVGDPAPILVGGVPVGAELLMARSLAWVVGQVSRTEGEAPTALAVTYPANWGEYKLDLLRQAIRHVGLAVDHLVPEPVAAARSYAAQRRLPPGALVAVYDLGGGTFDAAVVRVEARGFALLGRPDGIERLGGIDFDQAVLGHVLGALGLDLDRLDGDDDSLRSGLAVLRRDCVEAKEALSSDTDVSIPVMLPAVHTQVRLTRSEFEAMVRPALEETIVALRRAVTSAGVAVEDLTAVLLVGGSSRIPLVGQLVGAELRRPIALDARPKDSISMGAALLAAEAAVTAPGAPPSVVGSPAGAAGAGGPTRASEPVLAATGAVGPAGPVQPDGPAQSAGRRAVAGRPVVRIAVALVAVVAVLLAILVLRDDGAGNGGGAGDGGNQAAARPTEGYDPAVDGGIADNFDLGGTALTVGWKDQSEAELLGQITDLALQAAGAETTNRVVPVASEALHDGLISGEVDLYWDYMVDVWRGSLGRSERADHDTGQMQEALNTAEADADNGVVWLAPPTAFDAAYTFLVSVGNAQTLGLGAFSDLGVLGEDPNATLCATQDPSALVSAVEDAYQVRLPDWQQVEPADLYSRVSDGSCTVGVGVATAGSTAALGLVPLEDDRGVLGAANAALGARAGILDDHPELQDLVAPIAQRLDDETMRSLNARVEVEGVAPRDVGLQWLAEQGFVPRPGPTGPDIAAEFDLSGASFTVGSVGTDEQVLLGEITLLALEQAGAQVEVRTSPVGTTQARDDLVAGRLDLYWEYLAEAWLGPLGHVVLGPDADVQFDQIAAEDAANGVQWMPPAGFNRGWSIVTTRELADELGIDSIADLEALADDDPDATLLCSEINDAGRGWIREAYGFEIRSFEVVEDDVEGQVDSGQCSFGMVRGSNPWVVGLDLTVLHDERQAMPPDRAAVPVRAAVAEQYPQLRELVTALGDALTDDVMRTLNSRVVADGENPAEVAEEWLREAGFIRG